MTRRTLLAGSVAVISVLALSACGQVVDPGPQTSQQRPIAGVHAVALHTSGDLTVQVGDAEALTVTAGTNVVDKLTSDVTDGTLVLDNTTGAAVTGPITYTLTVRDLDRIELDGSGSVTGSAVPSGEATVMISGSGSATLSHLQLTTLTADLSGSGGLRVSGTSTGSTVTVSGSGDYDGASLATERTTVGVSGSGQARVSANVSLDASVSGSGDVIYTGNPASVQQNRSGSGEITAG